MGCGGSTPSETGEAGNDRGYVTVAVLGEGGYGKVVKVKHVETGNFYALKEQPHDTKVIKQHNYECDILKKLTHPRILRLHDDWITEPENEDNPGGCFILTNLCEGGDLFDRIDLRDEDFSLQTIQQMCLNMVSAINYCHKQNIAHRDIKPENFVFDSNRKDSPLRLIDLGCAMWCPPNQVDKETPDYVGSVYYVSPEANECRKGKRNLSLNDWRKCDMWSIGVTAYIICVGGPPFCGRNDAETYNMIARKKLAFPKSWDLGDECKDFIQRCCDRNPNTRITSEEALAHPFITSTCPNTHLAQDYFEHISNFHTACLVRKALGHILSSGLSDKDKERMSTVFKKFDTSGDGRLCAAEVAEMMKFIGKSAEDGRKMMEFLDHDGSGEIEQEEFMQGQALADAAEGKIDVAEVFKNADKDGNGTICKTELMFALANSMEADKIEEVMEKVDVNKDGTISIDEWATVVKAVVMGNEV